MSTRLMTLEDAWSWYEKTRLNLLRFGRFGTKHWDTLPWDGPLGKDEEFKELESVAIRKDCQFGLEHLDDFAVLILFSVFEENLRDRALILINREKDHLKLDLLKQIVEEAEDEIRQGSFYRVLKVFKVRDHNLVEQVNQIRKYRNWVAHGRSHRVRKEEDVDPETAFQRLKRFLDTLSSLEISSNTAEDD